MNRSKFSAEVLALIDAGELHTFDAEWIVNLPIHMQLAAALKCCRIDKALQPKMTSEDNPKSRLRMTGNNSTRFGSRRD